MDVRPLILAATFLLLVVSVAAFIVAVVRASSRRAQESAPAPSVVPGGSVAGPVDTDLAGLDLRVSPDALSATLLTPLRTGEWTPPESPAPIEELTSVALEERRVSFAPGPDVPEPAFARQAHEEWVVDVEALAAGEEADEPPAPSESVFYDDEPAPRAPVVIEPRSEPAVEELEDDFHAEIAALLPPEAPQSRAPVQPESSAVPTPAPEVQPVAPAPVPQTEFWEQGVEPVPAPAAMASVAPRTDAPRPQARVAPVPVAEPPLPVAPPPPSHPARVRPVARVHAADGAVVEYPSQRREAPTAPPRDVAPEMVLQAPVEMWFGDTRIGVKAGTATYERFRKYADALFDDLRGATPGN